MKDIDLFMSDETQRNNAVNFDYILSSSDE